MLFFCPYLVPSCIFPVYFWEPLGSFFINILLFIDQKKKICVVEWNKISRNYTSELLFEAQSQILTNNH